MLFASSSESSVLFRSSLSSPQPEMLCASFRKLISFVTLSRNIERNSIVAMICISGLVVPLVVAFGGCWTAASVLGFTCRCTESFFVNLAPIEIAF